MPTSSVISFLRQRRDPDDDMLLVVCNFTPVPRHDYRVGVPRGGAWREVLNSDAPTTAAAAVGNVGEVNAEPVAQHGRPFRLRLTVPPLGLVVLRPETGGGR